MREKKSILIVLLILVLILISSSLNHADSININCIKSVHPTALNRASQININDPEYDIILYEGFENNNFPPQQWTIQSENNNYTWQKDNVNTYAGIYSACCQHDPRKIPQNEWLITPPINLTDYYESHLSFHWFMSYFWSVYPYDNYDFTVYIRYTNRTDWIPLWSEGQIGIFDNWIWYNTSKGESIDLSSYANLDNLHIGFQYSGADGAQLNVDDICIYGNKHANPLTVDTGGPYNAYVGETIFFYGNASGGEEPYEWSWDFGDGNRSIKQNPTHAYDRIGNYSIFLQVEDSVGISNSDTTTAFITNMSKVPELIITNVSGVSKLHATILNVGDCDATEIYWEIHINNMFFKNITKGNISCIKKKCCHEIHSNPINRFGIVNVNILVEADNMDRISKQFMALTIGRFIIPL